MAWETVYDGTLTFTRYGNDEPFGSQTTVDAVESFDNVQFVRLSIEGMDVSVLPNVGNDTSLTYFGGYAWNQSHQYMEPDFSVYNEAAFAPMGHNQLMFSFMPNDSSDDLSAELTVKIEIGEDDPEPEPTPSKNWKTVFEVAQAEFSQNEYVEGTRSWLQPYNSSRRMAIDIKGADKIRITLGNTAPVVLPQHEEAKTAYGEGTYEDYAFTPSFANYPVAVHLNGVVYIPLGDGTSVAYDIKIEVEEQGSVHIKETVDADEYIEWQRVYNGSIPVEKGFMMPDEADITIDGGEKYHVTKNENGDYGELDPNTHATSFENYPFYISYDVSNLLLRFNFQTEGSYLVEISAGSDDPTPSKKSASIGVKEAMKHLISTLSDQVDPRNTIKGLTKQMLDVDNEFPTIQNARTIADIWEQAAILNGYEPEEPEEDNAIED